MRIIPFFIIFLHLSYTVNAQKVNYTHGSQVADTYRDGLKGKIKTTKTVYYDSFKKVNGQLIPEGEPTPITNIKEFNKEGFILAAIFTRNDVEIIRRTYQYHNNGLLSQVINSYRNIEHSYETTEWTAPNKCVSKDYSKGITDTAKWSAKTEQEFDNKFLVTTSTSISLIDLHLTGVTTYSYDENNRCIKEDKFRADDTKEIITYEYSSPDKYGNPTKTIATVNTGNKRSLGITSYEYYE